MPGATIPYEGLRVRTAGPDQVSCARPWGVWATCTWTCAGVLLISAMEVANRTWDLGLSLGPRIVWAITAYCAVLAMIVLATRSTLAPIRDYLGLARPRLRDILLGIVAAILVYATQSILQPIFQSIVSAFIEPAAGPAPTAPVAPMSDLILIVAYFETIILAPIAEEILFRGFMYRGLVSRLGNVATLLITSAAFGLIHKVYGYGWEHVLWSSYIGLFLGALRWYTGGIAASIIAHAVSNSPLIPIVLGLLVGWLT